MSITKYLICPFTSLCQLFNVYKLLWNFSDNIALHKIAWQLHPYENPNDRDFLNASNAVDGLKTNLSFAGRQCTQSKNYVYEAEWRVDLGAVLGIHHITIYYRTDNVKWGKDHDYSRLVHTCTNAFKHSEKEILKH